MIVDQEGLTLRIISPCGGTAPINRGVRMVVTTVVVFAVAITWMALKSLWEEKL
jgi:hypothetical protein